MGCALLQGANVLYFDSQRAPTQLKRLACNLEKPMPMMAPRIVFSLCAIVLLGLAAPLDKATAQEADLKGVKTASNAFYAALMAKDRSEAMRKVWANKPYVTYVGPGSRTITVGWESLSKYWSKTETQFSKVDVTLSDQHLHRNGNLAWEMGQESGTLTFSDGKEAKIDFFVTNVYEKLDGRWYLVSHHVQPKPKPK